MEAFYNLLRMIVVKGKNDGLANHIAIHDAQTFFHQVAKHLVHGIFVEEVMIYLRAFDITFVWSARVKRLTCFLVIPHFLQRVFLFL